MIQLRRVLFKIYSFDLLPHLASPKGILILFIESPNKIANPFDGNIHRLIRRRINKPRRSIVLFSFYYHLANREYLRFFLCSAAWGPLPKCYAADLTLDGRERRGVNKLPRGEWTRSKTTEILPQIVFEQLSKIAKFENFEFLPRK